MNPPKVSTTRPSAPKSGDVKRKRPRPHRANKLKQSGQMMQVPKVQQKLSKEPILSPPNLDIASCSQPIGMALRKRSDGPRQINQCLFNSDDKTPFFFESKSSVVSQKLDEVAQLCEITQRLTVNGDIRTPLPQSNPCSSNCISSEVHNKTTNVTYVFTIPF